MERPSLRQIECALAVAEHKSFRRAAEATFITQPALSQQVAELERRLGTQLFERDRRRVLVTEAGERLLPRLRAALLAVDGLVQAAETLQDPRAGALRLGVIPTLAPYVLPTAVPRLRKAFPSLRLYLREDRTSELVSHVRDGHLDLALLALEADLEGLETLALYSDPFVLLVPSGHPLAERKVARAADLSGEEVLLLEDGHCLREQALSLCRRTGAHERSDFRATSMNTLVRMVAAGTGVTLLPTMAVPVEVRTQDRLSTLPIEPRHSRTVGLAWRPTTSRRELFEALGELLTAAAPKGSVVVPRGRR